MVTFSLSVYANELYANHSSDQMDVKNQLLMLLLRQV